MFHYFHAPKRQKKNGRYGFVDFNFQFISVIAIQFLYKQVKNVDADAFLHARCSHTGCIEVGLFSLF